MAWIRAGGGRWPYFSVGGRNLLNFSVISRIGTDVVFAVESYMTNVWIPIDLVFVSGRRNWVDLRLWMVIDFISVFWSKLSCFSRMDWNWLVFSVWIEVGWVLVSRHRNWHDAKNGNTNQLISGLGRNCLCFCFGGSQIDGVLVWGSKFNWFSFGGRTYLHIACRTKTDLLFVWLGFCLSGRSELGFSVESENDLVLVRA